jgi:hypothetical protein
MSEEKTYTIDISNIKYFSITIIFNESDSLVTQTLRFFEWYLSREFTSIQSTDTVILELDDHIIELNPNYKTDKDISYKYHTYGQSPSIFPKSIEKEVNNKSKFYLSYIEPKLSDDKYVNIYSKKLFKNFPNKIKHEPSFYCGTYGNIYDDKKIAFGIEKINYPNVKSSRYAIGYDSTILDLEEVKSIIKEIFYK